MRTPIQQCKRLILGLMAIGTGIFLHAQTYDFIAKEYSEDLVSFRHNGKYGYLDRDKKIVIKNEYDYTYRFRDGKASVQKGGKWGFIDKQGNIVLPIIYEGVEEFGDGLVCVKKNGKWGFINSAGNTVIDYKYGYGSRFDNGYAFVSYSGRQWGLIDKTGREVI